MSAPESPAGATVTRLMREIEEEVRRQRRTRILARGGPAEYEDARIFAIVDEVLRRAVDERDPHALLVPELIDADEEWDLVLPLKFASHRPLTGGLIVWVKKHVFAPLMHWLYEYSLENFRRQQRVNRLLFAAVEELALENAKVRTKLTRMEEREQEREIG